MYWWGDEVLEKNVMRFCWPPLQCCDTGGAVTLFATNAPSPLDAGNSKREQEQVLVSSKTAGSWSFLRTCCAPGSSKKKGPQHRESRRSQHATTIRNCQYLLFAMTIYNKTKVHGDAECLKTVILLVVVRIKQHPLWILLYNYCNDTTVIINHVFCSSSNRYNNYCTCER